MEPPSWSALKPGDAVKSLRKVTKTILDAPDLSQVVQKICDSLLTELESLNLGYRIIVPFLYDDGLKGLQRISVSYNPETQTPASEHGNPVPDILIPADAEENFCVKSFITQKSYVTHDWNDLLHPPLSAEDARKNQETAGIKTSIVFPVTLKGKSVGTVMFGMVKDENDISESISDACRHPHG